MSIFGTTSILAGIVMLITPGPGIITILMGLMALGTEFAWARWLVSWAPKILRDLAKKALDLSLGELDSPKATPPSPASSPSAGPPITTAAEPSASEVDTISVSDTALPGSSNPVDPPRAVTDAL